MIASHYAEPLARRIAQPSQLKVSPSADAEWLGELAAGDAFLLLDDTLGWAWGYAGKDRRVGYVPSEAVRPA